MHNFFEHSIGIDEYITGNRFIDICDELNITFCKTDYINHFSNLYHKVFVTHNSDYHIENKRYSTISGFGSWFAQNKDVIDNNIVSIPIGVENMILRTTSTAMNGAFSSEVKGALQKSILMDKINSFDLEKDKFCYMNFNINTYPAERQLVWDMFNSKEWVTSTSNLSLEKFYFDLASSKFVISPRGNGVDCHRTWEALYLRTIPIVKKSIHMNEFSDLPIFFVNNWEELSYNKLNDFYEQVKSNLYNLDKLKISYWKQRIKENLNE